MRVFSTIISVVLFLVFTAACDGSGKFKTKRPLLPLNEAFTLTQDFKDPESAYYDANSNTIYVSSISGGGMDENGEGYISKLTSHEGDWLVEKNWATGLNGPKGMRVSGDFLFVTDINKVVAIKLEDGSKAFEIPIEDSKFLNDIAVTDNNELYVSDTLTSTIHYIVYEDDGDFDTDIFVQGEEYESPNGLLVQGEYLIVAAWGLTTDFNNETSGHLYKLKLSDKSRTNISAGPIGNLDGLEANPRKPDQYFVSDWVKGSVFTVNTNGARSQSYQYAQGAADIGYIPGETPEEDIILIPSMKDHKLRTLRPFARP